MTDPRDAKAGWTLTRPVTAPGAGHHQDALRVRTRASVGTFTCGTGPNLSIPYTTGLGAHPEAFTLALPQ